MFLFLAVLLFIAVSNAYDVSSLNDFSADVDVYDMGRMGRGKNACSWNRSLKDKQEVFYYLAMQPWRHLEWTDCTGAECYKFFINEDASLIPKADGSQKLTIADSNDYCRKEYANPMPTFDIDWNQVDPNSRLEAVDINGETCYKYPAQQPLAHIYLQQQYMKKTDVDGITPCRYDFIGGKSITFRSFNSFNPVFIGSDPKSGYQVNKTRCNIDPSPNNVDTDIALVLGISDTSVVQTINGAFGKLSELQTVKQFTVYYLSGESLKKETVALKDLASLRSKSVTAGPVDALINTAKNDLTKRVNAKAIYRGTIIALMDRSLSSTFDAETAFDRNNITVHTILYNPKGDNQMRVRARSLLSVGDHYHEFTSSNGVAKVVEEMYIGLRTNLTERCNRTSCDGFCDGRDRCTCPMCCENTCFFSYCNATTATCKPWPEANPKKKIQCIDENCVGKQECIDLVGCVYKEYHPGCAPRAKCMKPYCEGDKCKQESSCEKDKTPSYDNRCWSYKCNEENGNCERDFSGDPCPKLTDLCHEYSCDANLKCTQHKKTCVKTEPYVAMNCYKAECNKRTGMCENVLNCGGELATLTGCGGTGSAALCTCNKDFSCSCTGNLDSAKKDGFCTSDQICDMSDESQKPTCRVSACNQDLYKEGCLIKKCNETEGEIYWEEYDCSKNITIQAGGDKKEEAQKYCINKFGIICDDGDCLIEQVAESLQAACGFCSISDPVVSDDGYHKTYTVSYSENCNYLTLKCPNGKPIEGYEEWFPKVKGTDIPEIGVCKQITVGEGNEQVETYQCVYNNMNDNAPTDPFDICAECFSTAECYKNKQIRTYSFNKETGTCSMIVDYDKQPACSVCNADQDGFDLLCYNKTLEKTWTTSIDATLMEFKYTIPKLCYPGDQCVTNPFFDCTDKSNGDIGKIYELLENCANHKGITAEYHYSKLWDYNRYMQERGQTQQFLDEMDAEAYCTWSFEMDSCKYCTVSGAESAYQTTLNDKCDDLKKEFAENGLENSFEFSCNETINECQPKLKETDCKPKDCFYQIQKKDSTDCESSGIGTCAVHYETIEKKLNSYVVNMSHPLKENFPEVKCNYEVVCDGVIKCDLKEDDLNCKKALEEYKNGKDFGCRRPKESCDYNTYRCEFEDFNMTNPADDIRFFYERDNVVFGDLCYQYTCQEFYNETSKSLEHHWVQTEETLAELAKKPETICDTVKCNPETGKSESERRQCNPVEDYGLTEAMAMCFECACSMMTGENVLTMRPDTLEETYELDACGNCVVKDRATGQQTNEVIPCVLAQPVNLTGAIAGATVAASVVFGLIGSMVVVSIGAFQTYQLVSSAMKNVISTTLENPEFVAADNEATNVLNNE